MKIRYLFVFIITVLAMSVVSLVNPNNVSAAEVCRGSHQGMGVTLPPWSSGDEHVITLDTSSGFYDKTDEYFIRVNSDPGEGCNYQDHHAATSDFRLDRGDIDVNNTRRNANVQVRNNGEKVILTLKGREALSSNADEPGPMPHVVHVCKHQGTNYLCTAGTYFTNDSIASDNNCVMNVSQMRNIGGNMTQCYQGGCLSSGGFQVDVTGVGSDVNPYSGKFNVVVKSGFLSEKYVEVSMSNGSGSATFDLDNAQTYTLKGLVGSGGAAIEIPSCRTSLLVRSYCDEGDACNETPRTASVGPEAYKICNQIDQTSPDLSAMYIKCMDCVGNDPEGRSGIWTAIGCIKKDPIDIVQNLIKLGLGMGGGIALIMILASGFIFSISQGDAKRTGEARDMLVAAVTGLIFIIFSVTILQFIGYTVFKIPGFGG